MATAIIYMLDSIQEEFEDTKGVIRICISKKNRKHNANGQRDTQNPYIEEKQATQWKKIPKGNHNLHVEEEQTIQWAKYTKGIIRICISKKNRQHNGQRYQKDNQNPHIEEKQATQWPMIPKG